MIGCCIGIIGGNMLVLDQYVSLFFLFFILIVFGCFLIVTYQADASILFILAILLGGMHLYTDPLHQEAALWQPHQVYRLSGKITEIVSYEYDTWVTIDQVQVMQDAYWKQLKRKVQLKLKKNEQLTENDLICVKAQYLLPKDQMNPSDFDNEMYLKGKEIAASFKVLKIDQILPQTTMIEKIKNKFIQRIESLYFGPAQGIMKACLIGVDHEIPDEVQVLYNESGISHVLAISGFHVGVIVSYVIMLLSLLKLPYGIRQIITIGCVWCYAALTAGSISTMRAVIMATVLMSGRLLWQEEDSLTNIALAAAFLLWLNPYQLFQVGFQLSFAAVISLCLCLEQIAYQELLGEWQYPKWQKTAILWLGIQLGTAPILAYHFFEIPFLISLINLVVIPVFSLVIIGGWLSVLLFPLFIARWIAIGITAILTGIAFVVEKLLGLPLATLCVGRPSWVAYMIYGGCMIVVMGKLFKWSLKRRYQVVIAIIASCYILAKSMIAGPLKITALYVGQGDGIVIETPHHQMLVMDGGNVGQGGTIENYIKYNGKKEVDAMFLSHSDADHISGLIEIIEGDLKVNKVFISNADRSSLLDELLKKCQAKNIPVYALKKGDHLWIDNISFDSLAPNKENLQKGNDCSMVQLVKYGHFSAVFTGDMSCDADGLIYPKLPPVTLLKVSHHGSRTGTDSALLLKLMPSYAMISCGKNNLYGHPHDEVLNLLEANKIHIGRTDEEGAICYETDGFYFEENKFRKEVSS